MVVVPRLAVGVLVLSLAAASLPWPAAAQSSPTPDAELQRMSQVAGCPVREVDFVGWVCDGPSGLLQVIRRDGKPLGFVHPVPDVFPSDGHSDHTHGSSISNVVNTLLGAPSGGQPVTCAKPGDDYYTAIIYARPFNTPDNYARVKESVPKALETINGWLMDAAQFTGGQAALQVQCRNDEVEVHNIVLPTPYPANTFGSIYSDLIDAGFTDPRVKLLVHFDQPNTWPQVSLGPPPDVKYPLGLGMMMPDDSHDGRINLSNGNIDFPLLAVGYNLLSAAGTAAAGLLLHEWTHTSGGVQVSSPFSDKDAHCKDGADIMCGGPKCTESAYDCGREDYFRMYPDATAYLDCYWNIGDTGNRYLEFFDSPRSEVSRCLPRADPRPVCEDAAFVEGWEAYPIPGTILDTHVYDAPLDAPPGWDLGGGSVDLYTFDDLDFPEPFRWEANGQFLDLDGPHFPGALSRKVDLTPGIWELRLDAAGNPGAFAMSGLDVTFGPESESYALAPDSGWTRIVLPRIHVAEAGAFTVAFLDKGDDGRGTLVDNIQVCPIDPPPTGASFGHDVGCVGEWSYFAAWQPDGSVSGLRYLWDFGDGSTSTLRDPQHRYERPGFHNVRLTVTDEIGRDYVLMRAVYVCDPMPAPTIGERLPLPDADGDGVTDVADLCPAHADRMQGDQDRDGSGDACSATPEDLAVAAGGVAPPREEPDADRDGWTDLRDNCPQKPNHDQLDRDGDGAGDACDLDRDGDGLWQAVPRGMPDNCPDASNPDQADRDGDGIGDACDSAKARLDDAATGDASAALAGDAASRAGGMPGWMQATLLVLGTILIVTPNVLIVHQAMQRRPAR